MNGRSRGKKEPLPKIAFQARKGDLKRSSIDRRGSFAVITRKKTPTRKKKSFPGGH